MKRRVVVTGIGMISPLGLDVSSTWQALVNSQSGVDYITLFDTEGFEPKIAAEAKGFNPRNYFDHREARHMDRFTQFAVVASLEAAKQANINGNTDMNQVGVVIGSGIGGLETIEKQLGILMRDGAKRVNPYTIPMMIADSASGMVSMILGAKGPNFCATSACSSGSDAIGEACEIIKRGDATIMIAGGSEAAITPLGITSFNAAGALSKRNGNPQEASRPFDAERDGFVMGEGSAVLVLESFESALERGVEPLAEIVSYGASSDAYHITKPAQSGEGAVRAINAALRKGEINPGDIDYINAHGTSTQINDRVETQAIKTVFGERSRNLPISSTKSMTGHLCGAAGAIEAGICILTIIHGIVPPTINLKNPDPECDLNYVPNIACKAEIKIALSNSLGFGGHNSALIFRTMNCNGGFN